MNGQRTVAGSGIVTTFPGRLGVVCNLCFQRSRESGFKWRSCVGADGGGPGAPSHAEARSTRCCELPELNMLTERKAEETMFKSNGPLAQCIRGSVVAVSVLCLIQDGAIGEGAESSRRWGRVARFRAEMKEQAVPEMKRPNPYDTYKQWYPRYEGAFHSRYFNDLGIPPGDVGLRGNGLTMTPW